MKKTAYSEISEEITDVKPKVFRTAKHLFTMNMDDGYRVFVNQGGTSSAKTFTLLQVILYHAIKEKGVVCTVVGQDIPNLKVGALRDMKNIIGASEWLAAYVRVNESTSTMTLANGSLIEFKSYADEQDAKSGKRDYLFVNEANGITYPIYWQLAIRTRKKIWIDYNPTARFWVHDEVIGREGVRLIISNHRDNPFLTEEEHERIENISDPELWKVYARGLTGKVQGLVLTNWDIVDALPDALEWKMSCRGLDFGFTNDPSALEHVVLAHGDLWVDEELYQTGMTNPMLARKAKEEGVTAQDEIIADCAEPKSIQEMRGEGLWVVPSLKGQDSIVVGLDILRRYRIHVTRRSKGLIDNLRSYSWSKDRDGNMTNKPEDRNNHGIDAVRYVALKKLNTQPRPKGVRRAN